MRGGLAAWLTLAWIWVVVIGLARPVTAAAEDRHGHDQCQTTAGSGYYGGSGGECPPPAAAAQPVPAAQPAPAPTSWLPVAQSSAGTAVAVTAPPAPALSTPGPATVPPVSSGGTGLLPSLLAGAALAALAVLLLSGFRARRGLRQGWD